VEAAHTENIRVSGDEMDQRIETLVTSSIDSRFPDRKMLRTYLERESMSYDQYCDQIRQALEADRDGLQEAMLLEKLQAKQENQVQVTEETVKDEYRQTKARHILIKPEKIREEAGSESESDAPDQEKSPDTTASDQAAKQQARQQANELLEKIRQGADFAELAREHSDDPGSAEKGGDLGWFGRRQMVKEFADAAFALQPGEVSDVVESPFGFHIIKAEDRRIELPEDFEENKQRYIDQQQSQRAREVWNEYKRNLREQASIEIHDPELQAMIMVMKGHQPQAIALLKEAVANDPYNLTARYTLANAYKQQENITEAIRYFREIVENPDGASSTITHLELAKLLREQGKREEALQQFASASDWATAFQYQNYRIHAELERIYEEMEHTEGAQQEQQWLDEFQEAQAESAAAAGRAPISAP